jgi:hypothetical protein
MSNTLNKVNREDHHKLVIEMLFSSGRILFALDQFPFSSSSMYVYTQNKKIYMYHILIIQRKSVFPFFIFLLFLHNITQIILTEIPRTTPIPNDKRLL